MPTRRDFLRRSAIGLAASGVSGLWLRADEAPTEHSGDLGTYGQYLKEQPAPPRRDAPGGLAPTEDNILGPFHRKGAPFRAKITPPLEPGKVLLISGRVWGHDSRKPLENAVMDIWQANSEGRYDNDDPSHPPAKDVFQNRARLVTDESGYYEYETVHPGAYQIAPNVWRPSHIHYWVRCRGYQDLITQLYFKGDPRNDTDTFIKKSLIIALAAQKTRGGTYEAGSFDIVLAADK